jgi:hypothetical protein
VQFATTYEKVNQAIEVWKLRLMHGGNQLFGTGHRCQCNVALLTADNFSWLSGTLIVEQSVALLLRAGRSRRQVDAVPFDRCSAYVGY